MKINDTIITPILTEKATDLARGQVYTFEANIKATKAQIKQVLEKLYGIEISNVRVMIRKGKNKKVGRKWLTKKMADRKIAYVKVTKGKIDLFPQT